MTKNKLVFHDRQDADGNWEKTYISYDIPYYNMPDSERTAIRLYELEDEPAPRPWQTERNLCKGGDPIKWPGKWKQTLDENMYMPVETMGNYAIHNTVMTEVSQLNHNLSKSEENRLLYLAAKGDLAARNKVIEAHLSLAYKIAATQKRAFKRLEFTEMLAVAFYTVVDQVDRIVTKIEEGYTDHKRIYTVIHQPIIFAIKKRGSKHQIIPIPDGQFRANRAIHGTMKDLFLELLRIPEKDEILKSLGWTELRYDNVKAAMNAVKRTASYDNIDNPTLEVWDDNLGKTREYNLEELTDWALENKLKPKEADVIAAYYGIGEDAIPLKRISQLIGLAGPNVSKTKKRAEAKLKEFFEEKGITRF